MKKRLSVGILWKVMFVLFLWGTILSFLGSSELRAQDFSVDFSAAQGFGVEAERFQINNINVYFRITDPFSGQTSVISRTYNVLWRFDYDHIVLAPERLVDSSEVCQDASLTVMVTNALTGEPIPGALVSVSGVSARTDQQGQAQLNGLPEGEASVSVAADGYGSQDTVVSLACGEPQTVGIALLPVGDVGVASGDIRIILTWGENPHDLDSHLTGPTASHPYANDTASRFHVYFANKNNCDGSPCDPDIPAWLDVDDVTSFGPETITITKVGGQFVPGRYRYSVYHYSGSSNIPNSGATVKIFVGDRLVKTYRPPAPPEGVQVGEDWVWTVCDIMIDDQGHVTILDVNTYTGPTYSSDINSFSAEKTFLGIPVGPEDPRLFQNLPSK